MGLGHIRVMLAFRDVAPNATRRSVKAHVPCTFEEHWMPAHMRDEPDKVRAAPLGRACAPSGACPLDSHPH